MIAITRFNHPATLNDPGMFVLRADSALWAEVVQDKVGDKDMVEPASLLFSGGMHPRYVRHVRLVASDGQDPVNETDVVGVATLEFPMIDNPHLVTISIVVRESRRRGGIGSALHAAALELAREHGRSTVQVWTCEPARVPDGHAVLPAETGTGGVQQDSPESRFLLTHGYRLGQFERNSRLTLPPLADAVEQRNVALKQKSRDYELITVGDVVPVRLLPGIAELCVDMSVDVPTGALDVEEEAWDAARLQAQMESFGVAGRKQLMTLARHVPTGALVAFTRIFRDSSNPEVAHQWETLVRGPHRGIRLGMMMKLVNHAAAVELWPGVRRIITGNADGNRHMLGINRELGYAPYAGNGWWEKRLRGTDD